jgi:3-deoxy-D-manno-octulosonic-acid transferase
MYLVYSLILAAGALLTSPYWLYRGLRERKYLTNFRQRLGWHLPPVDPHRRPLWIHAVSVGEVLAAKPLSLALRKNRPHLPLIVSTVTIAGQALARKTLSEADAIIYFPFDFSFSVRKFLRHIRPLAVLLLETELWPNFLRLCRATRAPVLLANGRISDKSLRRYQRIRKMTTRMLADVDLLCVQTPEDRVRFLTLGAPAEKTHVSGNLKFDSPIPTCK